MKKNKELVIAITLISAGVFLVTLYQVFFYAPTDEIPLPSGTVQQTETNVAPPIHLTIPKIKVSANIQYVGITNAGNMATPSNYTDVAWYKYGVAPGEVGSAVMAGHVDNGLALSGVFYHLKDLQIGDDIYVATKDVKGMHFIVSKIDTYAYNDRNTDVFTERDGKLLKLITCTGTWTSNIKTHDKRLVVTATLSDK